MADQAQTGPAEGAAAYCPSCHVDMVSVDSRGPPPYWECQRCHREEGDHVELLRDRRLLRRLVEAIAAPDSAKPLVGEYSNAAQLLLIIAAKCNAEVRGNSAGGKNSLVDHVLSVWDPGTWKKVAGMSDKAIRYMDDPVRILYIVERRGMESGKAGRDREETSVEYDVKVLMSEGVVEWGVVEHDPVAKRNVLVTHRRDIDSFITTTTKVSAPSEYENRLFVLQIDDSEDANRRVRDAQLSAASSFSWDKREWAREREIAARAIRYALRSAPRPEDTVLPFESALKQMLSTGNTAVRRNTPKLIALVKTSARLHFLQRERTDDGRGLVASPRDLVLVLSTSRKSFEAAQQGVTDKVRLVYEVCKVLDASKMPITSGSIMDNLGRSRTRIGSKDTLWQCIRVLSEVGALVPTGDKYGRLTEYGLGMSLRAFGGVDIGHVVRGAADEYHRWAAAGEPIALVTPQLGSGPSTQGMGQDLSPVELSGPKPSPFNPCGPTQPQRDSVDELPPQGGHRSPQGWYCALGDAGPWGDAALGHKFAREHFALMGQGHEPVRAGASA